MNIIFSFIENYSNAMIVDGAVDTGFNIIQAFKDSGFYREYFLKSFAEGIAMIASGFFWRQLSLIRDSNLVPFAFKFIGWGVLAQGFGQYGWASTARQKKVASVIAGLGLITFLIGESIGIFSVNPC